MKQLLIIMLMMLGVTTLAQRPKYIYFNAYSKGKPFKTLRIVKLYSRPKPKLRVKYIIGDIDEEKWKKNLKMKI